jgi:hypothetical protein
LDLNEQEVRFLFSFYIYQILFTFVTAGTEQWTYCNSRFKSKRKPSKGDNDEGSEGCAVSFSAPMHVVETSASRPEVSAQPETRIVAVFNNCR